MTLLRWTVQYLYAPVFFIGFITASVWSVGYTESFLWLLILLLLAIAFSFAAEHFVPYEITWNTPMGDRKRDIVHAIVNEASNVLAIAAIPLLATIVPTLGLWPTDWPLWLQLAMAIVIADAGITIAHYVSHRINVLWRLHAVHHSVKRLYGFNGLMKHPLHQAIELVAGTSPLLLLGLPVDVGALLAFAVAIQLLLQHSNVDMRVGPLIYVWAVAPGHRHHHRASATDGDVNFGLFTMIWDHLLGTFTARQPAPRLGEVGIDGETAYPNDYLAQLVRPFLSNHSIASS